MRLVLEESELDVLELVELAEPRRARPRREPPPACRSGRPRTRARADRRRASGCEATRDARGAEVRAGNAAPASPSAAALDERVDVRLPRAALGLHVFETRARVGVLSVARRERARVRARRLVVVAEIAEHVAELEEELRSRAALPCACAAPARGASAPCSTCRGSSRRRAPLRGSHRAQDSACTRPGSASAL